MAGFRTLRDLKVEGRRVLVRADLNVPMRGGMITDETRIERLIPTLQALAARGARTIVMSHFGRPKGRADQALSLRPVAPVLAARLGRPVRFVDHCTGPEAEAAAAGLGDGEFLLLENLRFAPGEEANDPAFADALARLGECYVNDAFSCSHRAHASTTALAARLPSAAGLGMQAELEALSSALDQPKRPAAAIIGGAKVSTKLDVLGHLVGRLDALVIGGAMANTFLGAGGIAVGRSLQEVDLYGAARVITARAETEGCRLILPRDAVVAAALTPGCATDTVPIDAVPADRMILDIGPQSVAEISAALGRWRTLVWNGPLGAFETPPFDGATVALARAVAACVADNGLIAVAGGGDTVAALNHAGVGDRMSYLSTAGGAFLEWLEGRALPGVVALRQD